VSCCKPRLGRQNVWTQKLAELLSEFAWQRAVNPFFLEQGADGLEGWMLHELNKTRSHYIVFLQEQHFIITKRLFEGCYLSTLH